jgi:transposase
MYSTDLIILANNLYQRYKNYQKVESIIQVSKSTIQRWVTNLNYYLKQKEKQVRERKLSQDIINFIFKLLEKYKQIQLKEIQNYIIEQFNKRFSLTSISKYIREIGYSRKLISRRHYNKSIDDIINKQNIFKNEILNEKLDNIISIDESYFYYNETLNYGWSRKGEKCIIQKPFKRNKHSLLMAISNKKIIKYYITPKSINKEIYLDFLKKINLENKSLLADNVAFHKSKEVLNYIKEKNSKMIFIPPYSPEFNPIEFVFSEIKRKIRKQQFNNVIDLLNYLQNNLDVPSGKLDNYFKHSLKSNLKKTYI